MSDVRVRMYNVGFGDAFLVIVPTAQGDKKILFDCGTIKNGPHDVADVAKRIVADVKDPDGKSRIDVVVCTHRHADHVSGFADSALWSPVEVAEVWMPWTEHPTDPDAQRIREAQSGLAAALRLAISHRAAADPAGAEALDDLRGLVLNALSNEPAMTTLHSGFTPLGGGEITRRFLPTDAAARSFKTPVLPGMTIHVLGPSRDEEVIARMDPPVGQSYLRLSASTDATTGSAPDPFPENWWMDVHPFGDLVTDEDRKRIRALQDDLEAVVAAALDDAVNNTSLMLVLEIGKARLVFPGDAQWGTWEVALADKRWVRLLKKTDFYKIGHHGSHNATPRRFVEEALPDKAVAMASVTKRGNWKIPKKELLTALGDKQTKIARSDKPADAHAATFTADADWVIETKIPS